MESQQPPSCMFPLSFVYYPQDNQQGMFFLPFEQTNENDYDQVLKQLQHKVEVLQGEVGVLGEENTKLKKQLKPKRRYSKRRADLKKEYVCPIEGCGKCYSSTIALRSHLKQKHHRLEEN